MTENINEYAKWFYPPGQAWYANIKNLKTGRIISQWIHCRDKNSLTATNACYADINEDPPVFHSNYTGKHEHFKIQADKFGLWVVADYIAGIDPAGTPANFKLSVTQEILEFADGRTFDITIPGGGFHYCLWEIKNQRHVIHTTGEMIDTRTGNIIYKIHVNHATHPPEDVFNPILKETRKAVLWTEEWHCEGSHPDCGIDNKIVRYDWMGKDVGRMWKYWVPGIMAYMEEYGSFESGDCLNDVYNFKI